MSRQERLDFRDPRYVRLEPAKLRQLAAGLVKKSGTFFAFGETRLGQGRENAKAFLRQHPAVSAQLEHAIRGEVGTVPGAVDTGDDSILQLALEA